jgi:hypothetical protein
MATVRFTGKDLKVFCDNASSSITEITHVTAATVTYEYAEVETKGDTQKAALAGQLISAVEVEYEVDTTATTGNHALLGSIVGGNTTSRTVEVRPIGTGSALSVFTMEGVLLSYGPTGINRDGNLEGKAVFKHHANATDTPAWGSQPA